MKKVTNPFAEIACAITIWLALLICCPSAVADDQPVLATIQWLFTVGPPQTVYESPEAAFSAYQSYLAENGSMVTLSDLRPCSATENGGWFGTANGVPFHYCWTRHLDGGSDVQGSIAALPTCPEEKPSLYWIPRDASPPPNVSHQIAACAGPIGGRLPEPSPPSLCANECGNPIQVETRTKIERTEDVGSSGLLRMDRTYASSSGEWRHTYSDRAWNLALNSLDNSSANPYPACFDGTLQLSSGAVRRCMSYVSNEDLQRPDAGDWLVQRADGRTVTFSSVTGRSNSVATHETAHQILDGSGNYNGLVIYSEDGFIEEFDHESRLIRRSRIDGGGVVLTYLGPSGQKIPASAPSCEGLTTGPLVPGSPSCVTDIVSGRQLIFEYNGAGRLTSVTTPAHTTVTYEYDGSSAGGSLTEFHPLTSVTYTDSTQRVYHYNEPAQTSGANLPWALTGITDESSARYTFFGYDSDGHAISTSRAGGVGVFSLNGGTVTDPLGTQTAHSSALLTATASDGSVISSVYAPIRQSKPDSAGLSTVSRFVNHDAEGNIESIVDFNGTFTTFAYDAIRNLQTQRVEASGTIRARTISTQWHPDWRTPTQVAEPQRMTWWIYNGQPDPTNGNATQTCAPAGSLVDGKPIAVLCKTVMQSTTDLDGTSGFYAALTDSPRIWTYTYNSFGQVLTADGPRTDITDTVTYTYRAADDPSTPKAYRRGDLHTITNFFGHVTTYNTYNAHGQPLTITDPNGIVTTLTYDLRQRLTSRTVDTEQTTFECWSTGLLKKATLPDGSYIEYTYDAAHRLTAINDARNNRIEYTLDAMGNRTQENVLDPTSALRQTRTRVFNTLNQLSQEIGAAGTPQVTTTFGYDDNGNQTSIAAPMSRTTAQTYDELNRLTTVTDPGSGVTTYGYDALDQLISVTDPRTLTTTYSYNGLGDLMQQASPDTGTTTNTYDSGGNLKTSTDARSAITTYTYDALNRVLTAAFKIGATTDQTITYSYDAGTNGKGHLTATTDANHALSWTYDALGRVTGKGQTVGAVTQSVGYGYVNGQLTTMTLPSGQIVTYGYNSNGQVTSVTVGTTTILSSATYQPFGPVTGWTWGNATTMSRTFDTDGKLTQFNSGGLKTYAYDDAFRLTGITDTVTAANSWTYGYDALDRITSGSKTGTTLGWTYDANGNRLTQTGSDASTYTISGATNRIDATTGALARTYSYDAAGNTLGYTNATATYNNRGRMKTLVKAGVTATYIYDALGQRIKQSGGTPGTVLYMYDEAGHLIGEYSSTGALVQETVWLGDIPVATLRPNGASVSIYYVHTDHLNTPIRVTRPSDNKLMWSWNARPFGTDAPNENPASGGTFKYNLRFPGQLYDSHAGLHQNHHRDYDPATGKFPQSDPIGLKGGVNTYAYAENNPVAWTDPTGLAIWICNRAAFGGRLGNHSYLWDDKKRRCCGTNHGHDPLASCREKGPSGDSCIKIPGSDGKEHEVINCCQKTANKGLWIPGVNDCHTAAGDCITSAGLPNPGAPGGRMGECDSCFRRPD